MKSKILLATICSLLISCATLDSDDAAQSPAPETNVASEEQAPAPVISSEGTAGMAEATSPLESPTDTAAAEPVPAGVEQVSLNEPAAVPELKPVHPATAWMPSAAVADTTPVAAAKKPAKKQVLTKAKSAKALKAAKKEKAKKAALAKKSKKGKTIAKKPTKAECKKFAKNAKKHKKELAVCKIEKKKATAKLKKSRKVARG